MGRVSLLFFSFFFSPFFFFFLFFFEQLGTTGTTFLCAERFSQGREGGGGGFPLCTSPNATLPDVDVGEREGRRNRRHGSQWCCQIYHSGHRLVVAQLLKSRDALRGTLRSGAGASAAASPLAAHRGAWVGLTGQRTLTSANTQFFFFFRNAKLLSPDPELEARTTADRKAASSPAWKPPALRCAQWRWASATVWAAPWSSS